MSKGVLLFAFNSPKCHYYDMAVRTAKRINYFLDLPVSVVTDNLSVEASNIPYTFDNVIITEPDKSNKREKEIWINKGRYQAFELSPYDETILLDTDYIVNSTRLLDTFKLSSDFCCHNSTAFIMQPDAKQEVLSHRSFRTLWATVVKFKKTHRVNQIFDCLKMVQHNYVHYENLHGFVGATFRNDYALSIALRIANGHMDVNEDIIPWNLIHVGKNTNVYRNTPDEFNTEYTILYDNWKRGKIRKEYITVKDYDFHMINKEYIMDLI